LSDVYYKSYATRIYSITTVKHRNIKTSSKREGAPKILTTNILSPDIHCTMVVGNEKTETA